jgi:NADP-dependent 3-hydroxy acid dehydrogenase YdfG
MNPPKFSLTDSTSGVGGLFPTVSTAGLKIVPDMGVYAATRNAVRTVMEALRQESTAASSARRPSPGFVRTELDGSIDDPTLRLPPRAVARAVAFAVEKPHDVEIGDITIRPTVQG